MTIKRLVLVVLTAVAICLIGLDLLGSFNRLQVQSQLELYQTNLLLQATELQGDESGLASAQQVLLQGEPLKTATEQYQDSRQTAQTSLQQTETLLASASKSQATALQQSVLELRRSLAKLDLNLGILQVEQEQIEAAQQTWAEATQQAELAGMEPLQQTADVLIGLWSRPAQLMPEAEPLLKKQLTGWFRYRGLTQLYQLQQRQTLLAELQVAEQQAAERSLRSLAILSGVPVLGSLLGVGILLFLLAQWAVRKKQALLSPSSMSAWSTPWNGEVIWEVLIFGFFLASQLLLPLSLELLRSTQLLPSALDHRAIAVSTLLTYLVAATWSLSILYLAIKPFLPLPDGWFRVNLQGRWWLWGIGGYLAALPLVILVSLINQQIWQGKGGSNPILPIALENKDSVALTIFFITASVAAPIFEELLFRGFLLPSLTRYFPMWGAIALSSVIFAVAHLNLSEVLPLMTLGMVLGFVYVRSRNLLSSMLLHGIWNSGTLVSLLILGSATGSS
ncbi:type II CAAX prenyl endopeptidase Rce1 family protein [Pantanalinema rosaneae CENA516]|uniref:CPBP family intramembrane glutamic endopeptidase n=1 Tax=Pantanalinema rosaneae TaxID=1620701 RepID=UPI003D6EF0F1